MVSGDDSNGRLSRKTTRSPNRKSKKADADLAKGSALRNDPPPSVHKRNLYVVSFPIIILFNILRSLLYQLFIVFKYLYSASHRFMRKPCKNGEYNLEVVVKDGAVSTEIAGEMAYSHNVGPGDPLLAKQKHHHRKAFEYISKALKIDEENEGQKELAIELYKKGIYELERGIAVDCWGGRGDAWQRAQRLHDKMKTNLGMAKDRLHFLVAGRKLTTGGRRLPGGSGPLMKSQTLPRSMGRSSSQPNSSTYTRYPVKPASTPPAVKRQLSVPVNGSPVRRAVGSNRGTPTRSRTPQQTLTVRGVDPKLVQLILDEIVEGGPKVQWDDIAGQEAAKQALQEMVVLPSLRPELFTGLRSPAKGLLLFGPPGNGKTLLARCVAAECSATFFSISAATLTSKYVGDGEKMVRALFQVARELQPSIIFVDEVDSLLCERSSSEHEASRRLKTEFLVEFDGLPAAGADRLIVMAATNRPHELDEAALRRFPKRVYVSLPDVRTREQLLRGVLARGAAAAALSPEELARLAALTDGYSGSDLTALCRDAALQPIRGELTPEELARLAALTDGYSGSDLTALCRDAALQPIRGELTPEELARLAALTDGYSGSDLTALCRDAALQPIRGELTPEELARLAALTDGYSGSDLTALCRDAALQPIRGELTPEELARLAALTDGYSGSDLTALCRDAALQPIRGELTPEELARLAALTDGYSGSDLTALCRDAALQPIRGELTPEELARLAALTDGYSGSDLTALCRDAALQPIRGELTPEELARLAALTDGYSGSDLTALCRDAALQPIRGELTPEELARLAALTDGYSGSDLTALCRDAALQPIRGELTPEELARLAALTDGYSGSDLTALCRDAALQPIRGELTPEELARLAALTDGYSGSDLTALCRDAALQPIRGELTPEELARLAALTDGYSGSDLTALCRDAALQPIRGELTPEELARLAALTDGYSGSDLTALCRDAALQPIRGELTPEELARLAALTDGYSGSDLTALCRDAALQPIRGELTPEELARLAALTDGYSGSDLTALCRDAALQPIRGELTPEELARLAALTDGYSGSDLTALCRDAALQPIRELDPEEVKCLDLSLVRPITFQDFMDALKRIRPSVSPHSLVGYEKWSVQYGDLGL
ncbi:uncharacterized protein LOC133528538 isoform X4 [Cydia pomonella]|uniref:uncharacterized protein LOC133528538 isoform X4 n=1 Tax=Cydia pomonella TaxID=82600 RepID=UPI002ADDA9FF|nr:uncharacterized protein LOC133528538 isoform X4 [Cydia pomonella]